MGQGHGVGRGLMETGREGTRPGVKWAAADLITVGPGRGIEVGRAGPTVAGPRAKVTATTCLPSQGWAGLDVYGVGGREG